MHRLLRGQITQVSALAPSFGGPTDPDFASVKLLCGFNGVDGATSATDESSVGRALTFVGNAQLDTAQFKFGSASALFDGTGDIITAPASADFQFGSGAFTIDGFFRFAVNTTLQTLVSLWLTTTQRSWTLAYRGADATDILRFDYSTAGTVGVAGVASSAWTPTVGTWYHISLDRSGDVFRVYVDGVMLGSQTAAVTLHNSTTVLRIGCQNSSGEDFFFNGHMDELRITKGIARCGSDGGFTVPVAAYPRA